jgi:DNA-binding GntR family transcriptional regulator
LRRDESLADSAAAHTRMIEAIVSRDENAAVESAKQLIAHLRTLTP